jgi:DNA-directed RNA polymerase specialized sigma24 family protein
VTTEMLARDPFDVVAEREERVQKIKQALLSMTQRQLQVLVDHELRGTPLPKVARTLRISREEAERQLALARQRLSGVPASNPTS